MDTPQPSSLGPIQPISLTAAEELALQTALDSIVYDSLQLATFGLGILFLVLAVSHPFVLPAVKAIPLSSIAAVSATVFFLGFLYLGREATPTHLAHPIAVGICGLILVNSFLHLFLVPEPQQTTNLILFLIGVGLFLLSVRWLIFLVTVTWIGWGALVWIGPPSRGWIHFGFALFLATVLAVLVHMARLRTYRRLEQARLQGERDKNELAKLVQTARQSEERYHELFENSTDALVSFALDGMIFEANREAELLWGYEREEAIGQPFSKFITAASVELAQERILHALNGEEVPPLFELVGVRQDGSLVTIEGRSQFIRDAEQTPVAIQVAFRDVTDRKQAEEQQRRYAERLSILREIDHAIQMAQSLEAIAQAALPRLRQLVPCRRASVSLMDFSARESFLLAVDVTGETRFPTGTRLPFSWLTIVDIDAFQKGQIVEVEDLLALVNPPSVGEVLREEGIRAHLHFPLTARGETIGALSLAKESPGIFSVEHKEIAQEIANSMAIALQQARLHAQVRQQAVDLERKVAERTAELQAAEEEYRAIFEHANIGIYRSSLGGHQLRANPALVQLNGYASEEEMLLAVNDIATEWYVEPQRREEFAHLLEEHGQVINFESEVYRHKTRERIWISETARLVRDKEANPLYYEGTVQDITERKQAEEELRRAKEAAEAADRAKSEFLATMSHELRTPLHIILGYTDLLCEEEFGELTLKQKEVLQRVDQKARELYELITMVLDLTAMETGRTQVRNSQVHVSTLLQELKNEFYEIEERSGLFWIWRSNHRLSSISTDSSKLKVILKNLISNAVKFTRSGSVTVEARDCNGGVEFSVTDTGIGIAPEAQQLIFEPFYQLDGSDSRYYEGSGLGLHIVKRLLDLLGGSVTVESEVGRGSTFRVWIPQYPSSDLLDHLTTDGVEQRN